MSARGKVEGGGNRLHFPCGLKKWMNPLGFGVRSLKVKRGSLVCQPAR